MTRGLRASSGLLLAASTLAVVGCASDDGAGRGDASEETGARDIRTGRSGASSEAALGEIWLVHRAEDIGVDLSTATYRIGEWSTFGDGQRVELKREVRAGTHVVRIDGSRGRLPFTAEVPVTIAAGQEVLLDCETTDAGVSLDINCTVNGSAVGLETSMAPTPEAASRVADEPAGVLPEPTGLDGRASRTATDRTRASASSFGPTPAPPDISGLGAAEGRARIRSYLEELEAEAKAVAAQLAVAEGPAEQLSSMARVLERARTRISNAKLLMKEDELAHHELLATGRLDQAARELSEVKVALAVLEENAKSP